ncbi:MAG: FtsX-like permease family protein [Caldilineaceae bacterium]
MMRWRQLSRFALAYLRTVAQREWRLALLAFVGLAPGVAALLAWMNLAVQVQQQQLAPPLAGWLLPATLLEQLGAAGVLTGSGLVTLLIGALGLTNAYLASLGQRTPEMTLLRALGLRRRELLLLLGLEALAAGLLGSSAGIVLGLGLSRLSWPMAATYFGLSPSYALAPLALMLALIAGLAAALLFMHTAVHLSGLTAVQPRSNADQLVTPLWRNERNSLAGALFAGLLTWLVGFAVLPMPAALLLGVVAEVLAVLLTMGGWLLTRFYQRLPLAPAWPLWTLAVQGLARNPNHTAGMTLAMTTGAYAVGMAALSWLASRGKALFPFWVAGLVLIAGATLVFTVAALAAFERRREFGLLQALGARRIQCWHLILLEYAIVAVGGGALGAAMAFGHWLLTGNATQTWAATGLILADLLGALLSAWAGATPVLWLVTRGSVGQAVR